MTNPAELTEQERGRVFRRLNRASIPTIEYAGKRSDSAIHNRGIKISDSPRSSRLCYKAAKENGLSRHIE